jgi:hypothetical protein
MTTELVEEKTEPLTAAQPNEEHVFKDRNEIESVFRVKRIRSAEDWPEADFFKAEYRMPIVGSGRFMTFPLRGVSLNQWEEIEQEHTVPTWDKDGKPDEDFERHKRQIVAEKMAHVFEQALANGIKFPGETWSEKAAAIFKLNPGETEALYFYIQHSLCNFQDGPLLERYQLSSATNKFQHPDIELNSFADWEAATKSAYVFRMHRAIEDHIIEFPLKNISTEDRLAIDRETQEPDPPRKPKRDPSTKRMIAGETVPDYDDVHWKQRMRAVNQKRIAMYFNACLTFTIPGGNLMEQYNWIARRLMGDVIRLKTFIEQDLCGYESRYNFFTRI